MITQVHSAHSQISLENKCFEALLGVKAELSLMAWANKSYTLGFPTVTPSVPQADGRWGSTAPRQEAPAQKLTYHWDQLH